MGKLSIQSKEQRAADNSNVIITQIGGAIDKTTVSEFEDIVSEFFNRGIKNLILIFSNVEYINSRGIQALINFRDSFQERRGNIKLVGVPKKIVELFKILDILSFFSVYETEQDAMASISQHPEMNNKKEKEMDLPGKDRNGLPVHSKKLLSRSEVKKILDIDDERLEEFINNGNLSITGEEEFFLEDVEQINQSNPTMISNPSHLEVDCVHEICKEEKVEKSKSPSHKICSFPPPPLPFPSSINQQGFYNGMQESIIQILQVKFNKIPIRLEKRIREIQDEKKLKILLERAVCLFSLGEFIAFFLLES